MQRVGCSSSELARPETHPEVDGEAGVIVFQGFEIGGGEILGEEGYGDDARGGDFADHVDVVGGVRLGRGGFS